MFFARDWLVTFRPPNRGRRECRAPDAPNSRVCNGSGRAHTRCQVTPESPGIPHAMVLTAYIVLSPVLRAFWPPSPARLHANLTPASGCQDHTTSPSARKRPRLKALLASTASCPALVTLANAPPMGQDGENLRLIWVDLQALFPKIGNRLPDQSLNPAAANDSGEKNSTEKSLICPSGANQSRGSMLMLPGGASAGAPFVQALRRR
jgi:hypothetical protein